MTKISLGSPSSFFYSPHWSPDSRKITFFDKRLNLWMVDVDKGVPVKLDTDLYDSPFYGFNPAWSPDSRWVVYTKQLPNHLHAAWVYSLDTGKATQITDGLSNVSSARFDKSGDYLYFIASTSTGPAGGWFDMSSMGRAVDGEVYAMVLRKDLPSPVAPESDEEAGAPVKPGAVADSKAGKGKVKDEAPAGPKPVVIDFDHIDQRIVALPIARANLVGLEVGAPGVVFTVVNPVAQTDDDMLQAQGPPPGTLSRFDMKTRANAKFADGIDGSSFQVSSDGSKVLYQAGGALFLVGGDAPPKPGDGKIGLDNVSVWVVPREEWRQEYREAWRIERDFLYDPKLQGLPLEKAEKTYAAFVDGLGGRQDLNALFEEMTGHIGVGHTFIRGGDLPEQQTPVSVEPCWAALDYEAVDRPLAHQAHPCGARTGTRN